MHVYVALEQRFLEYEEDLFADSIVDYSFWLRYRDVFDQVTIVARAKKATSIPKGWLKASGPNVKFIAMPYYIGIWEYAKSLSRLWAVANHIAHQDGAFILRVPGSIGTLLWIQLARLKKPYALEVVGDPHDSLSPMVWSSYWIWPIRIMSTTALKWQCLKVSAGVAYVSNKLWLRYPAGRSAKNIYHIPTGIVTKFASSSARNLKSDVSLSLIQKEQLATENIRRQKLIFVGTLEVPYKGQQYLLEAIRVCIEEGLDLELEFVGDGRYRHKLEQLTKEYELTDRIVFTGKLSDSSAVLKRLQNADIFILPSLSEGLPRAMLEAMACGLPCIGTSIGGIPELLSEEDIVPPGNSVALAQKIKEVVMNPSRMREMSARNIKVAKGYEIEALREKRIAFYEGIKRITEGILKKNCSR